ncbi:hypothetical protein LIER_32735 [Lithospermum erythrorhizon]|uniref:Uncharacterized protein n=1 Tax=Lithospermum erythrorhizon TaxID=34254 RepID=A0AAV3RYQ4_LITER
MLIGLSGILVKRVDMVRLGMLLDNHSRDVVGDGPVVLKSAGSCVPKTDPLLYLKERLRGEIANTPKVNSVMGI